MIEYYASSARVNSYQDPWLVGEGLITSGSVSVPSLDLNFITDGVSPLVTFTRGSSATQFDSTGSLVYAPVNLLTYSEQFDNAAWTKSNLTISADAILAPSGAVTADKAVENTANATHNAQSLVVTPAAAVSYTFSCYLKAAERTQGAVGLTGAGNADSVVVFDLVSGQYIATVGAAPTSYAIAPAGNSWFRCSITWVTTSASAMAGRVYPALSGNISYLGDGTSGIYVWGAQLNPTPMVGGVTASLSTYYPTVASAYYGPRLDYDPTTLASQGLLIEEQRTNSIRNNTMQGAVAPSTAPTNWGLAGTTNGLVHTITGIGQEDGIAYIDIRINGTTTATATHTAVNFEGLTQIVASSGQAWAISSYLKLMSGSLAGLTLCVLRIRQATAAGTFVAATDTNINNYTGTLKGNRQSVVLSSAAATTERVGPLIQIGYDTGTAIDITLRIGLPQLEQGAFATSVIPTTTAAATRSADVASVNTLSPWYNATEGTLCVGLLVAAGRTADVTFARFDDGTSNNRIQIGTGASYTVINSFLVTSNVSQGNNIVSIVPSSVTKTAFAYATNSSVSAANNAIGTTDTTVTVPSGLNRLCIGRDDTVGYTNGYIRRITYYPRRLSDAELQAITS